MQMLLNLNPTHFLGSPPYPNVSQDDNMNPSDCSDGRAASVYSITVKFCIDSWIN